MPQSQKWSTKGQLLKRRRPYFVSLFRLIFYVNITNLKQRVMILLVAASTRTTSLMSFLVRKTKELKQIWRVIQLGMFKSKVLQGTGKC